MKGQLILVAALLLADGRPQQSTQQDPQVQQGIEKARITDNKLLALKHQEYGSVLKGTIWRDQFQQPASVLSVCWENPSQDISRQMINIRSAIEETWSRHSALKFSGWAECTSRRTNIRILVDDQNPHTKGLGNQLNNIRAGMVLNLTFREFSPGCNDNETMYDLCVRSIAVHEFGHAIGFAHEHNRDDRVQTCLEKRQGTSGDENLTPYDPDSVMNYCNPNYNNLGKLSAFDVISVQALYGSPPAPASTGGR